MKLRYRRRLQTKTFTARRNAVLTGRDICQSGHRLGFFVLTRLMLCNKAEPYNKGPSELIQMIHAISTSKSIKKYQNQCYVCITDRSGLVALPIGAKPN